MTSWATWMKSRKIDGSQARPYNPLSSSREHEMTVSRDDQPPWLLFDDQKIWPSEMLDFLSIFETSIQMVPLLLVSPKIDQIPVKFSSIVLNISQRYIIESDGIAGRRPRKACGPGIGDRKDRKVIICRGSVKKITCETILRTIVVFLWNHHVKSGTR